MKQEIVISWSSLWRIMAVIAIVAFLIYAQNAFLVLFSSIVLSSALDMPVAFLNEKLKIPRLLGTLLLFSLGITLVTFLVYIVIPVVVLEITSLALHLRGTSAGTIFGDVAKFINLGQQKITLYNLGQITDVFFKGSSPIFEQIGNFLSGITFLVSVMIISFYLTLTKDGVGRFLRVILPDDTEEWIIASYYRSKLKIAIWLRTQLLLSLIIGCLVSATLWMLGVKYSLVIGIVAGIFEVMPVVGPIFSGALGTLIALSTSTSLGAYTALVFLIIQQLENNILVPLIMGRAINIHPVVALFALMAGYQLFGIVGVILSVPGAVIVQDILETRADKRLASKITK